MRATIEGTGAGTGAAVTRSIGLTGRVVVGGTVSAGLLLGGYTVAAMALAGRINGNGLVLTSLGLFIIGSAAGLLVSTVVGLVGREAGVSWGEAGRRVAKGVLYAIPACAVGAVLAGWIAMAIMGLYLGRVGPIAGTLIAALIGLVVIAATFRATCGCCRNAARRWWQD